MKRELIKNQSCLDFWGEILYSSSEVETQLILAKELNFIRENDLDNLLIKLENIKKMLNGLIKHLKDRNNGTNH